MPRQVTRQESFRWPKTTRIVGLRSVLACYEGNSGTPLPTWVHRRKRSCVYIDINRYTLIDWINAGKVRASKIGNRFKIDRSYLADWLEARELATGV